MTFSILVPIYNVEKYLKKCLDSILAQSYSDFEVILVDDGSPDNCGEICDTYAAEDNRIRVLHKANGGLVSARQAALEMSAGEYIINVDSDDWIDRDYLLKADEIIREHHPDMIDFAVSYIGKDGIRKAAEPFRTGLYNKQLMMESIYPDILMNVRMKHAHYYLCGKVIRREVLYANQLAVDRKIANGEDVCCLIPTYADAESVYVSDYPVYFVCQHADSMSRLFKLAQFDELILGVELLRKTERSGRIEGIGSQIDRYIFHMCLVLLVGAAGSLNERDILPQIVEKMNDPVIRNGIRKAEFEKLSLKSTIVLRLLKNNAVSEAFRFLRFTENIKHVCRIS